MVNFKINIKANQLEFMVCIIKIYTYSLFIFFNVLHKFATKVLNVNKIEIMYKNKYCIQQIEIT